MIRLPPRARRMALGWVCFLALGVFPVLVLTQWVRSGRSPRLQVRHAEEIAVALQRNLPEPEWAGAATSTEVFRRLRARVPLPESHFFVPGFAPWKRRPDGDGELEAEENGFALVTGLPGAGSASSGLPFVLWDPGMPGETRARRWPLARPRWVSVDVRGRRTAGKSLDPQWWAKHSREEDLFPEVPGIQRLLRP